MITEQSCTDSLHIIRGKDKGLPAWHYIVVPANKLADIKAQPLGGTIDVTKFGCVIEYRNKRGEVKPMSGRGIDPPKMFEIWLSEQYGQ